jgi:hypothetical protein
MCIWVASSFDWEAGSFVSAPPNLHCTPRYFPGTIFGLNINNNILILILLLLLAEEEVKRWPTTWGILELEVEEEKLFSEASQCFFRLPTTSLITTLL